MDKVLLILNFEQEVMARIVKKFDYLLGIPQFCTREQNHMVFLECGYT